MPWTNYNYPVSMKNLPTETRIKAIEIANALLEEGILDEGRVIAIAISRAKEWAQKQHQVAESDDFHFFPLI
jgi:uncharacterized protein YdaT